MSTNILKPRGLLVVLISGDSPALQAILDACASGTLHAQVVAVISDKPDGQGLDRAQKARVHSIAKVKPKSQERREYEAELAELISSFQPDWLVLAGWTHPLSAAFIDDLPQQIISIHPALPGAFPGTLAVERAYYAYCRDEIDETGVTIYSVCQEGDDCGPVLAQQTVPIFEDDTVETLEERIQTVEQSLIVKVLQELVSAAEKS